MSEENLNKDRMISHGAVFFFGLTKEELQNISEYCRERGHVQQAAYTLHHRALTIVCLSCEKVCSEIPWSETK